MGPEAKKGLAVLLYPGFYEGYKDDLGHFFANCTTYSVTLTKQAMTNKNGS